MRPVYPSELRTKTDTGGVVDTPSKDVLSPIEVSITANRTNIACLSDSIAVLEQRLGPVLKDKASPPSDEGIKAASEPYRIDEHIDTATRRLHSLTMRVEEIKARLLL